MRTDDEFRRAAARMYGDDVEIDDDGAVSRSDPDGRSGVYVSAWVWVYYEDVTAEDLDTPPEEEEDDAGSR